MNEKYKNFLKSQPVKKPRRSQGFSLVEMIIAAAALGGLSLAVMNMTKTMSKSSVKYQFDSETNLITNEIVGILANPAKCSTTLLGKNALNAIDILSINGNQYFISSQPGAPGNGYGSAGIKITSYALLATNAEVSSNTSYLMISYQNKKTLGVAPNLTKKIKLYVEVDGTKSITSCHSISAHSPEIWTRGATPDIFYSGNVGIGTTAPLAPLYVMNTTNTPQIKVANSLGFGSFYYGSLGPDFVMSNGSYYDGTMWKATNTAASHLNVSPNGFNFHSSNGLIVGGADPLNIVMTIKNSGNIGIGETIPTAPLHVKRNTTFGETALFTSSNVNVGGIRIANTTSTNGWSLYNAGSAGFLGVPPGGFAIDEYANGPRLTIIPGGNIGIGTASPSYKLHVVGTAGLSTGTAWINASDIRLKDIHGDYEYGLDEILKLHTVRYSYRKDNALGLPSDFNKTGFIAQEVQKIIPEAVNERADGYLELNVDPIHWAVVNSIKDLYKKHILPLWQSDIKQGREIAFLKKSNEDLRKDNLKLQRMNAEINMRLSRIEKILIHN